jgi:hypothetical protein
VGARRTNVSSNDAGDYAVFCIKDDGSISNLQSNTALLTGVVKNSNDYYFSTNGGGIYKYDGSSTSSVNNTAGKKVKGITLIDDKSNRILAFCYTGDILNATDGTVIKSTGQSFSGPAALWWKDNTTTDTDPDLLLVAGTVSSAYGGAYGYREISVSDIKSNNISLREPGSPTMGYPSTMTDNKRYKDTIEAKPVNCILQVPSTVDSNMPLFASVQGTGTMKDDTDGGLWSLRFRDGDLQWNAE